MFKSQSLDLENIFNEAELHKLMNYTDNFDERKRIRNRLKYLRESQSAQFEASRLDHCTIRGDEDVVTARQRRADGEKKRLLESLEAKAAEQRASTKLGVRETMLRKQQNEAEETRRQKIQELTEKGQHLAKLYNMGADAFLREETEKADMLKEKRLADFENDAASYGAEKHGESASLTANKREKQQSKSRKITKTGGFGGTEFRIAKSDSAKPDAPSRQSAGSPAPRNSCGVEETLLNWSKENTKGYNHLNLTNFSSSWSDGMAFCALIHKFFPKAFDYNQLDPNNREFNFTLAFDAAHKLAGIAPLLSVGEMLNAPTPDSKAIFATVQGYYRRFALSGQTSPNPESNSRAVSGGSA